MTELGELEAHQAEFDRLQTRIVVVSLEDVADASKTQADFPHLLPLADKSEGLIKTIEVVHPGMAPDGGDTAMPTTILVDRTGTVRWIFRADRFLTRLTPNELLLAVRQNLPKS